MPHSLEERYRELEARLQALETENDGLRREALERQQVEEALRESERRYYRLFTENVAGFALHEIVCDDQGRPVDYRFMDLNPAFERLTGLRREATLGKTALEVLPGLEPFWIETYGRVALTGESTHFSHYAQALDKYYEVSAFSPVRGQFGVTFQDVTERVWAESQREAALQALRRERDLVSRITETSPAGIVMVNRAGRITFANRRAEQVLGLTRDEIGQRTYNDPAWHIAGYDGSPFPDEELPFQQVMHTGRPVYDVRHAIQWPDGHRLLLSINASPLYDETDQVDGMVATVEDVTERLRAQEALRESEERYRTLVENVPIGVYRTTPGLQGRFLMANPAFLGTFGFESQEELKQVTVADLYVNPRDRPAFSEHLLAQGSVTGVELLLKKRDSTPIWSSVTARVVYQAGNEEAAYFDCVIEDITKRVQAQQALRESERRFRDLFEYSPDAIFVEDLAGNVLDVNPAACRLHGMAREELLGKNVLELVPPDRREELVRDFPRLGRREWDQVEGESWTKDGRAVPVEIRANRIDYAGEPALLLHVRDIGERVRAQRLLEAFNRAALAMEKAMTTEEIFAGVVAELKPLGFSCVVFLTDESQSRLAPKYMSHEAEVRQAIQKLVGLEAAGFSIPVDTAGVYRKVVRERKTIYIEAVEDVTRQLLPGPAKRFAGQIVKMLKIPTSIAAPLIVEDEVIGVFSAQSDDLVEYDVPTITAFAHQVAAAWHKASLLQDLQRSLGELRRTQDQLVQAQKMEAIGHLAGGIAHDFNNLLTAINGFAELLQFKMAPDDPLRDMAERILKSGQRAADLVGQLLAFSRKQVIQPHVVNLNAVVADMEVMLRRTIGEDIQLKTSLSPELWPVKVDPTQIGQVIVNLAVNARDAMLGGGVLTIETVNVELDDATPLQLPLPLRGQAGTGEGGYVLLTVSDTGVGMSQKIQPYIFEPFFTTKERGRGTGLGLATVYGIVKQSGGDIQVLSQEGLGATFKIYLPRSAEAAQPLPDRSMHAELPTGSETILLVEDDAEVRELARRVLQWQGYTVLEAHDGPEALRLAAGYAGPIHLLLTDVVMPGMSGTTVAEELAQTRPGLGILFMSGYTEEAIADHGALGPGVAFLPKPLGPLALAHKVRAVLDARDKSVG